MATKKPITKKPTVTKKPMTKKLAGEYREFLRDTLVDIQYMKHELYHNMIDSPTEYATIVGELTEIEGFISRKYVMNALQKETCMKQEDDCFADACCEDDGCCCGKED